MSDSQRTGMNSADELVRLAAAAEPSAWEAGQTDAAIDVALRAALGNGDSAESRESRIVPRRSAGWQWAAAACVLLGLGAAAWAGSRPDGAAVADMGDAAPSETTTLETGDRVTATSEAVWTRWPAENPGRRQLIVERGTVLFDVEPLAEGDSFEVMAHGTRVAVRGTVFSVEQMNDITRVRVYEGRVEVAPRGGGATVLLAAGMMWSAGAGRAALADGQHAAAAREAVERRAEVTPPLSHPTQAVAVPTSAGGSTQAVRLATADPSGGMPEAAHVAEVAEDGRRSARGAAERHTGASSTRNRGAVRQRAGAATPLPPPPGPTVADAQGLLRGGDAARALALANDPHRVQPGAAGWSLLRADSLRVLGRHDEAADAYDQAARRGASRAASAYTAARLRFGRLQDPAGAIRSLDAAGGVGALGERALALRVRALVRLDRHDEARVGARNYLARFPNGGLRDWMNGLLE